MKLEVVVLGLLGLLHSSPVQAEDYEFSRVVLVQSGCSVVGLGDADLRAALASELSASSLALAPVAEASASTDITVSVREPCGASEELALTAAWRDTRFTRTLKLDELPRVSRARALALVAAELIAQFAKSDLPAADAAPAPTDAEPVAAAPNPTPEVIDLPETPVATSQPPPAKHKLAKHKARSPARAPDDPEADSEAPRDDSTLSRRQRSQSTHLGGALELRSFFAGPSLLGGRLQLDWDVFSVGLSAVGGNNTVSAGVLSAFIVHGTVAVRAVTLDTSAHTSLSVGPRVGLGYLTVSARSTSPYVESLTDSDPYLDGAAFATFVLHPSSSVRFGVTGELGYAHGIVALADTIDVAHYGGLFASALFDLAFQL